MFVFKRRSHHKSSRSNKEEFVEPEVEAEVRTEMPKEIAQLQSAIKRRRESSRSHHSSTEEEELGPDFREALYMVVQKRRKKVEKRNRIKTSEALTEEAVKAQSEEAHAIKSAEQTVNIDEVNESPTLVKKTRKEKPVISEVSAPETAVPKKRGRKPKNITEETNNSTE